MSEKYKKCLIRNRYLEKIIFLEYMLNYYKPKLLSKKVMYEN